MTLDAGDPRDGVVDGGRGESRSEARRRVVLVGFMGCGKTVVGSLLAQRLDWPLVDLDARIEASAGRSIPEIFAHQGEAVFRDLEHDELRRALEPQRQVIATGGGAFIAERNRALLEGRATSFWLDPGFDTLLARLTPEERAHRPLFRDPAAARALYRERAPIYALADHRVDVGDHPG